MSTPKFTPGPWGVADGSAYRVMSIHPPTYICDTANNAKTRTPENEANARLISAAPELYEALKEAQLWMTKGNDGVLSFNEMRRQAEAALAKAEGRKL